MHLENHLLQNFVSIFCCLLLHHLLTSSGQGRNSPRVFFSSVCQYSLQSWNRGNTSEHCTCKYRSKYQKHLQYTSNSIYITLHGIQLSAATQTEVTLGHWISHCAFVPWIDLYNKKGYSKKYDHLLLICFNPLSVIMMCSCSLSTTPVLTFPSSGDALSLSAPGPVWCRSPQSHHIGNWTHDTDNIYYENINLFK